MAAAPTSSRRPAAAGIRWDRLSRYALLIVFTGLVLLYVNPVRSYFDTRGEAAERREQVRVLEREHAKLDARKRALTRPAVVEAEARRLGMVRPGERPFVVRNLPPGK
jgi:cell division protein FtsB